MLDRVEADFTKTYYIAASKHGQLNIFSQLLLKF